MTASRDFLRRELERLAFTPVSEPRRAPRIGAEVEMLVVDAVTGRPSPISPNASLDHGSTTATLDWLRPLAQRRGWTEGRTTKGAPSFTLRDGSVIGFEPGGQIEYSSAPSGSASALVHMVRAVMADLRDAADEAGVTLLHVGIDPMNSVECVPLMLEQPRYARMDAYLATRGPSGRRMMRQTAATQVAVDLGPAHVVNKRWRLLNAAAPCFIAAFANSARYAGRETGHQSYRAHTWRSLDDTRTGTVAGGDDPLNGYLDFALRAPAMFSLDEGAYRSFDELAARGLVDAHDWEEHLSTLFPEVRPRGYLEVRSIDAVPPAWLPAVVGIIGALAYDPLTTAAANDLLPDASPEILARAGRLGLADDLIGSRSRDLLMLGLEGCARLGTEFIEPAHLEEIDEIVRNVTARGVAPADLAPATAKDAATADTSTSTAPDAIGGRLLPL